jgi:Tol biopolymer transport system component
VGRGDFFQTGSDIWLIDLARGAQVRLTSDPSPDSFPAWSPKQDGIVFVSTRGGLTSIYQKPTIAAGAEDQLVTSGEAKVIPDFSPDGRFLLYTQINPATNADLFLLSLSGERKPEPFLQTNFIEGQGRFSPNGRWVAYTSNETGQFEVYVQSFPNLGVKVPISTGGGSQPQWRGDGREIYYYTPDRKLMAIEVSGEGSTFNVGVARPLFDMRISSAGIDRGFPGIGYYTVARDGKRFLVATSPETQDRQQITVVLNWTADLKR